MRKRRNKAVAAAAGYPAPPNSLPSLLTAAQVAALLQVSKWHLSKLRMDGEGPPFIRVSNSPRGRVRYRAKDVAAWLESNRVEAGTPELAE